MQAKAKAAEQAQGSTNAVAGGGSNEAGLLRSLSFLSFIHSFPHFYSPLLTLLALTSTGPHVPMTLSQPQFSNSPSLAALEAGPAATPAPTHTLTPTPTPTPTPHATFTINKTLEESQGVVLVSVMRVTLNQSVLV